MRFLMHIAGLLSMQTPPALAQTRGGSGRQGRGAEKARARIVRAERMATEAEISSVLDELKEAREPTG